MLVAVSCQMFFLSVFLPQIEEVVAVCGMDKKKRIFWLRMLVGNSRLAVESLRSSGRSGKAKQIIPS